MAPASTVAPKGESVLAVESIDQFVIDLYAFSPEQPIDESIPTTRPLLRKLSDQGEQLRILSGRLVSARGAAKV
jgi:hypothetical protein